MADNSSIEEQVIKKFAKENHELFEQPDPSTTEHGQKGDGQVQISAFGPFQCIKKNGSFFADRNNLAQPTYADENLLDQILSGKTCLKYSYHVDLLCQTYDFSKKTLDYREQNLN